MKLGLGTAQFGFQYGISNAHGKPAPAEIVRILEVARAEAVQVIDTAHAYGVSEAALGHSLPRDHTFHIVTKTIPLYTQRVSAAETDRVLDGFRLSLERLRQSSVYGVLVHHAEDILAEDGARLMDALLELKMRRLVQKVGVSVYGQPQLDAVLARYPIDIVQVPLNVLDQRLLASGALARLKRRAIEVHARSVFLQGLLLMDPDGLKDYLRSARDALQRFRAFAQARGLTPVQAALRFVAGRDEVDCAVIGVARHQELEQVAAAFRAAAGAREDYSGFALDDESILNPELWPNRWRAVPTGINTRP